MIPKCAAYSLTNTMNHPFFRADLNRASAEIIVARTLCPVIRSSSVQGHYAITWLYNGTLAENFKINHSLLREEPDGRIANIACDKVVETWSSVHEAYCAFAWFSPLPLAEIMERAPSRISVLETIDEEDPTN